MSPEQEAEVVRLQRQMHDYLGTLISSGIEPNVAVTAAVIAATERVLVASTPTQTAAWLRGHALLVEKHGQKMLSALRA